MDEELDPTTLARLRSMNAGHDFAETCAQLRDAPESERVSLDEAITFLMTEFWDKGFSQTEIRTAFTGALDEMNRYAGGEEQRGGKPSGSGILPRP